MSHSTLKLFEEELMALREKLSLLTQSPAHTALLPLTSFWRLSIGWMSQAFLAWEQMLIVLPEVGLPVRTMLIRYFSDMEIKETNTDLFLNQV